MYLNIAIDQYNMIDLCHLFCDDKCFLRHCIDVNQHKSAAAYYRRSIGYGEDGFYLENLLRRKIDDCSVA